MSNRKDRWWKMADGDIEAYSCWERWDGENIEKQKEARWRKDVSEKQDAGAKSPKSEMELVVYIHLMTVELAAFCIVCLGVEQGRQCLFWLR